MKNKVTLVKNFTLTYKGCYGTCLCMLHETGGGEKREVEREEEREERREKIRGNKR